MVYQSALALRKSKRKNTRMSSKPKEKRNQEKGQRRDVTLRTNMARELPILNKTKSRPKNIFQLYTNPKQ
jgi:hypothetical protein